MNKFIKMWGSSELTSWKIRFCNDKSDNVLYVNRWMEKGRISKYELLLEIKMIT